MGNKDDEKRQARAEFASNLEGVYPSSAKGEFRKIVRNHGTVLKVGRHVHKEEGNALRVAHQIGLPVPAVHEISITDDVCGIQMDFVEGDCLEDVWSDLPTEQRISIAKQLGEIVSKMRAATPPSNQIGGCGGPARDERYISTYVGGPFEDELAFNDFILQLISGIHLGVREALTESLRKHNGQRIMLAHCDLSPRNIIVSKQGKIEALLDWKLAGWYPEYWEYVKFFDGYTSCKGWMDLAEYIFPTAYPSELVTYQAIARWRLP